MTTKPRNLMQRIKAHKTEIALAACAVTALTAYVVVARRSSPMPNPSNFFKNAADPDVEIILGNDDAFVVLTSDAMQALQDYNTLSLHDGTAGSFTLMFTEPNQ